MNNDRADRIRALAKVAVAILRRSGEVGVVDVAGGRARVYDVQQNEMKLSLRRHIDDPDHTTRLEIKFDGARVLVAEWDDDGFVKRSYTPGPWERVLRRYERVPALAGPQRGPASPHQWRVD